MAQGPIFRSPYPDVTIPLMSLVSFAFGEFSAHSRLTALIDGVTGRKITFSELISLSKKFSSYLKRIGFKQGDCLGILSPNSLEYPIIVWGVLYAGGVVTTMNPLYTDREVAFQLKDADAKILYVAPPLAELAQKAKAQVPALTKILVEGSEEVNRIWTHEKEDSEPPAKVADPKRTVALLPYSSGTTGLPKGVMLTHYNVVANICQFRSLREKWTPGEDVLNGTLPFYHIYGLVVLLFCGHSRGASVVVTPRFDLETLLRNVQQYRITRLYLVPPIILLLAKHPLVDHFDLSSVRAIMSGAAPLSEEVIELVRKRDKFRGVLIKQGYGMTELSPVSHAYGDADNVRAASVGFLLPNLEMIIRDVQTNRRLGVGEIGELCVRGPNVMLGYLNNPTATAETIDSDGFLHTGDIGYVDKEGNVYIVDRVKELIKVKGLQVAPAELEAILLSHPQILDAAVVPYPDLEAGEVPKAFIVAKPDSRLTAEAVMEYVKHRVAPHKRIRLVEFIQAIPKSASGKILRRELRARDAASKPLSKL